MTTQQVHATGSSMIPFILPGSTLTVERTDVSELRVGDVVCYIGSEPVGVAHRLIRIELCGGRKRYFVRGDAQRFEEEVPEESLVFVVRMVKHQYITYTTFGPVGRLAARLALSPLFRSMLLKNSFHVLLRLAVWLKQRKNGKKFDCT